MIHRTAYIVDFDTVTIRIELVYCSSTGIHLALLLCGHCVDQGNICDLIKFMSLVAVHDGFDLFIRKDPSCKNAAC